MGKAWKNAGKAEVADAKGRLFTKMAKEIMVAAKGGPDPATNSKLRLAVEQAKKASMPRDTLERAIKKGAGLLNDGSVSYEMVTYEGFAPHKVPVIVECLTDNKNRTGPNVRVLFRKGQLGSAGSVSWDFKYLGIIEASPVGADVDPEVAAIEAGAQDLEPGDDGQTIFYTEPTDLDAVSRALPEQGFTVQTAKLGYKPNNPVKIDDPVALAEVEAFLQAIDADDDVHEIYVGLQ